MAYRPGPAYSGQYAAKQGIKPLWTIDLDNEEAIIDWFKSVSDVLSEDQRQLAKRDLTLRDFYMGIQSASLGSEGIPRDREGKPLERFARVTINQCYELVEQWVSKMTRFAPAIAVIPNNSEYNDRIAAKMSKGFIDYLFYVNDVDDYLEEVARATRIDGESFIFVEFDKAKGDLAPGVEEAQELGVKIPLVDQAGQQVMGSNGEPLFIEKASRVGDVAYSVVARRFVLLEPKVQYRDVNWLIKVSSCDIDELCAKYPDSADDIEKNTDTGYYQDLFAANDEINECLVFEIIHRGTEFCDSGRYIKLIPGKVLENTTAKEKFGHTELPCVRLTNIDVPGMLRGYSFLEQIMLLQVMYNNLASIAYTNMALGSHIYWMLPKAANVDLKKIKNGNSVISFSGPQAPKIEQFKTVGQDMFAALEFVDKSISRLAAIQEVSRGEVPPGIEAGVALAFLEEQENQRANTDIKKHNAFIKKLARLSLATAGAFYDPADGRTIRIVGKNNQFSVKALDVAKLGGPYDIRVQRTTALSESKSGRLSQLLALEGRFPNILPREQVLDMLDLANDQKFYDLATVAVQAAERENELMQDGVPVQPAESYEDHILHLSVLYKFMQTANFKEDVPEEIKMLFMDHGAGHEVFLHQKLSSPPVNPLFAQKLLQDLPMFPVFTLNGNFTPAGMIPGGPTPGMPSPGGEEGAQGASPLAAPPDEGQPEPMPEGEQDAIPMSSPAPAQPPSEVPEEMPLENR